MQCLFCKDLRKNTKPVLGMGLICFRCFHILNSADQEYLKRLYGVSIEEGNTEKARLINNFLIVKKPGETNDRETKEPKRDLVRKRTMRKVRSDRTRKRTQSTIVPLD